MLSTSALATFTYENSVRQKEIANGHTAQGMDICTSAEFHRGYRDVSFGAASGFFLQTLNSAKGKINPGGWGEGYSAMFPLLGIKPQAICKTKQCYVPAGRQQIHHKGCPAGQNSSCSQPEHHWPGQELYKRSLFMQVMPETEISVKQGL